MFSKGLAGFVSVMLIQSIASQSIGVYNAANLGNAIVNTAVAAEAAAIAGNSMAYAANPANTYANVYAANGYASNCNGNAYASPIAYEAGTGIPGLTYGLTLADLAASNGGGLRVMSSSPIAPTGITVESDNMAMEGPLAVSGQLPFLGVVALEGPLPASGEGAVAYGSGNGNVGIVSEGINEPAAYANANANANAYANANANANAFANANANANAYANANAFANINAYANANSAYANGLGHNGCLNAPLSAVY